MADGSWTVDGGDMVATRGSEVGNSRLRNRSRERVSATGPARRLSADSRDGVRGKRASIRLSGPPLLLLPFFHLLVANMLRSIASSAAYRRALSRASAGSGVFTATPPPLARQLSFYNADIAGLTPDQAEVR